MANVTDGGGSKSEWRVGEQYYNDNGRRIHKQTWQNSDGDQWDTFDDAGAAPAPVAPPVYQPPANLFHSSGQAPGVAAALQAGTAVAGINPVTGTNRGITAGGPSTLSGSLAPLAPAMFGLGSSGPSAIDAERQRAASAAADAERLKQEEARRQRLRTTQQQVFGLAEQRQAQGTLATTEFEKYGVISPSNVAALQAKRAPLTQPQVAAEIGEAIGTPTFQTIWDALQAWYSGQNATPA